MKSFTSVLMASAGIAGMAYGGEFYVLNGNSQACIGLPSGLPTQCTNSPQTGIVKVDDFNCDYLGNYLQQGPGPISCNQDWQDWSGIVSGCRFGDSPATIDLVMDVSGEWLDMHVLDQDGINPDRIVATCKWTDTCEAGDVNSGVFFDSATCLEGLGVTVTADAYYKCTDFADEVGEICP